MIELSWGTATDAGSHRARNEDAYFAAPNLFVVADGMGGHQAGDVASSLAVDTLGRLTATDQLARTDVLQAVHDADRAIFERASAATGGMGTTICGLATVRSRQGGDERFVSFNVGDSRLYRIRDLLMTQLTRDHSVVQELIDAGQIAPREAATHPDRHVITRSLGSGTPLEIDWAVLDPMEGDRYLVTSDGLTKELSDHEIAELLGADAPSQELADTLVAAALRAGGRDNITVVVVEVLALEHSSEDTADPLDADTNPGVPDASEAITIPPGLL